MHTVSLYTGYVHNVIIQCTWCHYVYSHYNATIYSVDTVSHCIVTLCSLYKVSLCSVNTMPLILLNYTAYTVSLYIYIHTYNVTIQHTHAMSIYSVHTVAIKYTQCHYYAMFLWIVHIVTIWCTWYYYMVNTVSLIIMVNTVYCMMNFGDKVGCFLFL